MKIEKVVNRVTAKATGGALKFVAGQQKIRLPEDLSITGTVGIGQTSVCGIERSVAEGFVEKAHLVCPYSNATGGNINVNLKLL
jgi:osmotically inducible protein OsmC